MASDNDVCAECWRAAVPLKVQLSGDEVTSVEQPDTLYFLVPRLSYLHSVVPQALGFLQHVLPPGEHTPWFDYHRLPLKWAVPAGVLFDLLAREGEAPWALTLHVRAFPSGSLPAYGGAAALKASFFNSLKEAAFIARGSSLRVMEMTPGSQEDLWQAALAGDLPNYRDVLGGLQLAPADRGPRGRPCVPLRLYVRPGGRGYPTGYEGITYTSRPAEAQHADGGFVTLREALLPLVAASLGGGGAAAGSRNSQAGEQPASPGPAAVQAPADAAQSLEGQQQQQQQQQQGGEPPGQQQLAWAEARMQQVLVAGISPPLETPLAWLHAQLHAADWFLYVVVHLT